jgi:putative ABC transport system permease protein
MAINSLTYALRRARLQPGFSSAVILVMGLAVGATTALFTLVDTILLRPLPLRDPERLVTFTVVRPGTDRYPVSLPDLADYRAETRTLEGIAALFGWSVNLTGLGDAERLQGLRVTPDYFELTGAEVELGRAIGRADEHERVALISHSLWTRRFGSAPDAVGRTLTLNGEPFTIAGVLRPDFVSPLRDIDIVAPFAASADPRRANRAQAFLRVVGRLRDGVTPEQLSDDLSRVSRHLRMAYPDAHGSDTGIRVATLHEEITGRTAPMLHMLLAAGIVTLLVACANLANLFLVRGAARRRELAVRSALGAGRGRIARGLIMESAVLAAAGGALGLIAARALVSLFVNIGPADLPRAAELALDWRAALFALGVTIAATVVFGLAPAAQATRKDLRDALGSSDRAVASAGGRLRSILIFAEVALATLLLIVAALLARSFAHVMRVDPGFEPSHVLTIRLSLPRARYKDRAAIENFYNQLHPRLAALPGVRGAAAANVVPMNGYLATSPFFIDGVPLKDAPDAHYRMVSPDYFRVLGIQLRAGRLFTHADRAGTGPVAIVNQTFAQQYWPGASPIGARIRLADGEKEPRAVEVIGVIGNVKHFGLERETTLEVYVPIAQVPEPTTVWLANNMYWAVETAGEPLAATNAVRHEIAAVDPAVPASFVRSMDQWLGLSLASRRFNLQLVSAFTLAALVLAGIGVYALTASVVAMRTREIGIRRALGASTFEIATLVLRSGLSPVLLGLVVGSAAALVLGPATANLLFGVAPRDPASVATAASVLMGAALLASYVPARRAGLVDPIIALRAE